MNAQAHEEEYDEGLFLDSLMGKQGQIFLVYSGTRIEGKVIGYDDHSIIIQSDKYGKQLIYKSAISTIQRL